MRVASAADDVDVEERRLFKQNSIDKHERQTSKPKNSSAIDLIVPSPPPARWQRRRRGRARGAGARGRAEHGKAFEAGASQACGRRAPVHTAEPTAAAIASYNLENSVAFFTQMLQNYVDVVLFHLGT